MKPYAIGIDVGGTKITAGLVSRDGTILYRHTSFSHCEQEPPIVIDAIEQAYRMVVEGSQVDSRDIQAVGLGFPGNTNGPAGLVLVCSNLPAWDHLPLRDIVAERIGLPVILENDANLGAVGEHRYGAGRGTRNMCYVTFSTGYGMGIIANGELYVGHMGTAGEVGHVVIDIGGPPCTCGKRGCIMAYASGIGLSRMAYERIEAGAKTLLREMVPEDGRRFPAEVIAEAACLGDETAAEILRTAGYYAGVGLSMIVQILNPELIVLGGGLTHIGATLLDPAMVAMREHIQPEVWDSVRLVPWQLGHDLGIIGAAARVFTETEDFSLMNSSKEASHRPGLAKSVRRGRTPLTPSERARLERVEGVVFDIQRYSLHDGPGLRTNVFFKGCPLHCPWCANPESQDLQPEMALFARNCMACGQFEETCPVCWAGGDGSGSRRELEERLSRRVALCPTGAIHRIGERRSARDVMEEVLRDAAFYEDGGGMTLTGGEPTLQPDLCEALLRLAQADCISTALETCGYTRWEVLERMLPYVDDILFDVKHMDSAIHHVFTGQGNELILSNLRRLAGLGAPLTIRVPVVPGFNASPQSVRAIAESVLELGDSLKGLDLLPYHTLGTAKYAALGRDYAWAGHERLAAEDIEGLAEIVRSYGMTVKVGG